MIPIVPCDSPPLAPCRLICVDRNDKLCGLLSLSDLARNVRDNNMLGDLLRQIHLEKGGRQ
jgi:hypothetical protein